ncbi:glycoside hydrolase family 26 protein [Streptomyces sp. NPDC002851]
MQARRRMTGTCLLAVTASLLTTGTMLGSSSSDPDPAPSASSSPSPSRSPSPSLSPSPSPSSSVSVSASASASPPASGDGSEPPDSSAVATGAYLGYGPEGVARMEELSRWLGGSRLRVGHTYLPGDLWSNIEGKPGFLESWARWKQSSPDRMFVLNVPMLERNEEGVPDGEVSRLLRAGASGEFDQHFEKLARRLVDLGVPDTVIVLGWEMNGITYTHRCGPDPQAWKAYWKRIVTAMRSVPGGQFRFDFAPSRGPDAVPWTLCYPGDDVVDIIGMDAYDQPPGETFEEQVRGPYGLQHQVDFAKAHGKAISYPEWGLFRNGDNPEYMRGMLDWFARHKPLYQTISDYCPHGVWQCDDNPASSKVFRTRLFGKDFPEPPETSPPSEPTPTPHPTGVNPDQWCVPIEFGEWGDDGRDESQACVRQDWDWDWDEDWDWEDWDWDWDWGWDWAVPKWPF